MLAASNQTVRASPFVDVAVPAHRRREHEVPLFHRAAPSVDDRDRALGPGREPDRGRGVAVRHRPVAGLQHGEGGDQVGRRHRLAAERRVAQDQRAALDILDRDFPGGAFREGLDVPPAPHRGAVRRVGQDRRDLLVAVPERVDAGRFERLDQLRIRPPGHRDPSRLFLLRPDELVDVRLVDEDVLDIDTRVVLAALEMAVHRVDPERCPTGPG